MQGTYTYIKYVDVFKMGLLKLWDSASLSLLFVLRKCTFWPGRSYYRNPYDVNICNVTLEKTCLRSCDKFNKVHQIRVAWGMAMSLINVTSLPLQIRCNPSQLMPRDGWSWSPWRQATTPVPTRAIAIADSVNISW